MAHARRFTNGSGEVLNVQAIYLFGFRLHVIRLEHTLQKAKGLLGILGAVVIPDA